ncbi:MAG: bifunctional 3-hydroxydecanoyl-ACP dehydratase/trans-2-decenoyl-ACP isomerase [Pseudomonadota bacterium]
MMTHDEFLTCSSLDKTQLLAWGRQTLVTDAPGRIPSLPAPPMLMFDRVTRIERSGRRGRIVAEQDIALDAWFFQCHFNDDPVQPGCLGVDAVWQLLGMYCALNGALGSGRALGCRDIDFFGQIRPHDQVVTYDVAIRRLSTIKGSTIVIGNARVLVDGAEIYTLKDARVGVFPDLAYTDYPNLSANARGGVLNQKD